MNNKRFFHPQNPLRNEDFFKFFPSNSVCVCVTNIGCTEDEAVPIPVENEVVERDGTFGERHDQADADRCDCEIEITSISFVDPTEEDNINLRLETQETCGLSSITYSDTRGITSVSSCLGTTSSTDSYDFQTDLPFISEFECAIDQGEEFTFERVIGFCVGASDFSGATVQGRITCDRIPDPTSPVIDCPPNDGSTGFVIQIPATLNGPPTPVDAFKVKLGSTEFSNCGCFPNLEIL